MRERQKRKKSILMMPLISKNYQQQENILYKFNTLRGWEQDQEQEQKSQSQRRGRSRSPGHRRSQCSSWPCWTFWPVVTPFDLRAPLVGHKTKLEPFAARDESRHCSDLCPSVFLGLSGLMSRGRAPPSVRNTKQKQKNKEREQKLLRA